ncbi:MAG: beta-glucosidase [Bacteroidales bacterium]|nr:beta-glucosidase [Bacteroidales bacterium]
MKFLKSIHKKTKRKYFAWGAAAAAYQTEGAVDTDGKGPSIWDVFTHRKGKIKNNENGDTATDFYRNYKEDIRLLHSINLNAFRFSLSWPRIMPEGRGAINEKGLDYYEKVIDFCLERGIEPWVTLYHWDLPQALEDKGGWTNRDITGWFADYVDVCTRRFGKKVKNWIVLNEPMTFTGLGYYTGYHAPGRKGLRNFLPAAHHAALCQAEGGRIIRNNVKKAHTGTTFSLSHVKPLKKSELHTKAAQRIDAIVNRLFIEPALGMGYPYDAIPLLKRIEKYFKPGDEKKLKFDFDFYGVQYYFRLVSRFSLIPPLIFASEVPPEKRDAVVNAMGFEVYPKGLYKVLNKVWEYEGVKKIVVTECGVCYEDKLDNGTVHDPERTEYIKQSIDYTLKAIEKGVNIEGFFVWSLTDNFEWSEGYSPRFGLVYTDYPSLDRYIKDSGLWLRGFLKER